MVFGDTETMTGGDFPAAAVVAADGGDDASDGEVEPDCEVVDALNVTLEAVACLVGVIVGEVDVEVAAVVVSAVVDG